MLWGWVLGGLGIAAGLAGPQGRRGFAWVGVALGAVATLSAFWGLLAVCDLIANDLEGWAILGGIRLADTVATSGVTLACVLSAALPEPASRRFGRLAMLFGVALILTTAAVWSVPWAL